MRDSQVSLVGRRTLAYTDIGEPDWPCVFFFHGAPSSRLQLAYLEQRFLAEGIRVVSPDRPAYGGSSPQPGRSMAGWPADVAALADALGIHRFIVAGHSSGGPYAVACASLLPERVLAGVVFGGVTDMGWPGAWEGYMDSECELMRLPDEAAGVAWCIERYGEDGNGFFTASGLELTEPDNALIADERIRPVLMSAMAAAFRQGVTGYAQDIIVQGRPWPFDPQAIAVPVHVLHGALDAVVPLSHSRHTSEVIPGSTVCVLQAHGHVTTVAELPTLASALARSLT
jgi:pimeloyl-ACP methyl ester carboxylesterase